MDARRPLGLHRTAVGQKAAMALSGLVLLAYVVFHLLGNLQVYLGAARLDAYALFLHERPALLWTARAVLLAAVGVHVAAALALARAKRAARPIRYAAGRSDVQATWSSRTMMWSGLAVLAFVVYHVLHFTTGTVHPRFVAGGVYHNLVSGFRVVPVAVGYVLSVILLGMHLRHGAASLFQSLGVHDRRATRALRRAAAVSAVLLAVGYASMPLAVLAGLVGR